MKHIHIAAFILLTGICCSCKKFSDFQVDPNRTTQATPNLLLTSIEITAFNEVSLASSLASRYIVYTDGVNNNQYYGWQRGGFGDYDNLRQVMKMENEAMRVNKPAYMAIAKFFKSYYIIRLTQTFGDVPYTNALQGDSSNFKPVYDKQQDIYVKVLDELKAANAMLTDESEALQGDVVYAGDIRKWKRLINSFSLRVLMSLSRKESDAAVQVKQRFTEIVSNTSQYPLIESNADNAKLTFHDLAGNRYPTFNNNDMQTAYYMEASFVNLLKGLKDPRLFSFAEKAAKFSNLPDGDFTAYAGVPASAPVNDNTAQTTQGIISKINQRYYKSAVNEACLVLSYAELQFILAEAAARGWISGNAATWYKNGIEASFDFYGIDADDYVAQPAVQLQPGKEIQGIITQKYISTFMNSGWLPFYEQRRTGFPAFDVSGDGMLNNKRIPARWMYPENELKYNQENVTSAISGQYSGDDDINGQMWLLK
ncbi:SusD/RagB family nutrient-binding outer membrane lipoprotein [Foetidibacter luteolus]|uniref:SusD/RagB family nutrient-binding outer membrane lipoprotein n=1 Tax=Foetidibacter luteolus TaxID=2608880 RepID=UPI00129B6692|nr:SusD/RagB family nutrient-binding outer membrane lipoprotein [Foetidibacter luteolus]